MNERQFQAGDKVVCTAMNLYGHLLNEGQVYTVTDPDMCCGDWCFAIEGHGEFRFFEDDFRLATEVEING